MDVVLKVLSSLATVLIAVSFIFYAAARNEMRKDESLQRSSARGVVKMKRFSGLFLGIGGVLILLSIALPDSNNDVVDVEKSKTETVQADTEKENDKVLELGSYDVVAIPSTVPPAYKGQYENLADVISRTDATLTMIKQNISSCVSPCSESLDKIEGKFDAMSKVIEETRAELLRGSEIARGLAEEDPPELYTQKLYELEQELLATRYSLETMLMADSWESWEEPIEYAEDTRSKRLYKIELDDTVLTSQSSANSQQTESKDSESDNHTSNSQTYENDNIANGKPFSSQQLNEVNIYNEIAVDSAIKITQDMISMIYVCAKLCYDSPLSDIQLNLSYVEEDAISNIESLETMSDVMYTLADSKTPNIDVLKVKHLAEQFSVAQARMNTLLTKNDWTNWDEPGVYGRDLIAYLKIMRNNLSFY